MTGTKQGIQSVELAIKMLKVISESDKPLSITEISDLCEISKSKAYRYLISLVKTGFLEKDENLKYSLGNELTLIGIRALGQSTLDQMSTPYLEQLRDRINKTVAITLWGDGGPFFLKWLPSHNHFNIGIQQGSQIKVTQSASGKIYAAFLPREKTEPLVKRELNFDEEKIEEFYKKAEEAKKLRFANTQDTLIPAISAMSVPIFDRDAKMVASLLVLGFTDSIDVSIDSDIALEMKKTAESLSKELGYMPIQK